MKMLVCLLSILLLALPLTVQAQTSKGSRYELRLLVLLPELLTGDKRTVLLQLGRNQSLLPAHAEAEGRYSLQAATNVRSAVVYLLRGGVEERRDYLSWQAYGGERQTVQATYRRNAVGGLELAGLAQAAGFVPEVAASDGPTTGNELAPPADGSSPFQPTVLATGSVVSSTSVLSSTAVVSSTRTATPTQVISPSRTVSRQPSGNQPAGGANVGLLLLAIGIGFVALGGWRLLPLGKARRKESEDEQSKVPTGSPATTGPHVG